VRDLLRLGDAGLSGLQNSKVVSVKTEFPTERVLAILEDVKHIAFEAERNRQSVFYAVSTSIDVYVQEIYAGKIPTTSQEDNTAVGKP
jgi:hypothetical protein